MFAYYHNMCEKNQGQIQWFSTEKQSRDGLSGYLENKPVYSGAFFNLSR